MCSSPVRSRNSRCGSRATRSRSAAPAAAEHDYGPQHGTIHQRPAEASAAQFDGGEQGEGDGKPDDRLSAHRREDRKGGDTAHRARDVDRVGLQRPHALEQWTKRQGKRGQQRDDQADDKRQEEEVMSAARFSASPKKISSVDWTWMLSCRWPTSATTPANRKANGDSRGLARYGRAGCPGRCPGTRRSAGSC